MISNLHFIVLLWSVNPDFSQLGFLLKTYSVKKRRLLCEDICCNTGCRINYCKIIVELRHLSKYLCLHVASLTQLALLKQQFPFADPPLNCEISNLLTFVLVVSARYETVAAVSVVMDFGHSIFALCVCVCFQRVEEQCPPLPHACTCSQESKGPPGPSGPPVWTPVYSFDWVDLPWFSPQECMKICHYFHINNGTDVCMKTRPLV